MFEEVIGCVFGFEFFFAFPYHQGFGLGKEVGGKHLLVLVVRDGVVGVGGEDEVCWDDLCALVEELVEGVLSVGGWFAEKDWTGGVFEEVVG